MVFMLGIVHYRLQSYKINYEFRVTNYDFFNYVYF